MRQTWLDFGLAKQIRGVDPADAGRQRTVTEPGMLVGTPAYLAPELLRGQRPDAHSDVWAVGVLLYEMASGASPFHGGTRFELSAAILHHPPPPLSSRVPSALAAVIERCLHKEIARRYRDGNEVRAALDAVQRGTSPEPIVWRSRLARPRLAILPLRNLSGDPEQDYFAEGTHDALITDLAGISRLRVIARASVLRYRNREVPLAEIADELRVDLVLTGTVIRTSDRVRVTVQLLDVSNQEHLWAGRYDRPLLDVLSMQNDVVASIARAIELQLTPEEQDRLASGRPLVNVEAYEAYLKGRVHCYKVSPEHYQTARKYFLTALDKDPSYALAYAGLAFTWLMEGDAGIVSRSEALPNMTAAISKALELDDTLAEAHELSAGAKFLYEWDWAGAETEYVRTIELNPNRADAHLFYADFLAVMGREREASAEMARAVELDPLNSFGRCFEAWHRVYFGDYDEAVEQLVTILRAEPAFSSAHLGLWGAFYRKGLPKQALEAARHFFTALGDAEIEQSLTCTDGANYAATMHRAADVLAARARHTYVPAVRIARLYAHAAEPDRVFEWLEQAFVRRETPLIHLGVAWDWYGLRDDPRFESLTRRMNLPH